MPWHIRKRRMPRKGHLAPALRAGGPNHNQYKVYGENGNPLSKEWKTRYEAEKQLKAVQISYALSKKK